MPLGFKDYSLEANAIDASDKDSKIAFTTYNKVFGMYMPDAIAYYNYNGTPYLFTANEGDSREYTAFIEMKRAGTVTRDLTQY